MSPIDTILPKRHCSYQKYHLTKIAANINGTSQKWHLKTFIIGFLKYVLLIKPTPAIRHKLEKLDFKMKWSWVWFILQIYKFPLKNYSAQPLVCDLWVFFGKVCHFFKASFFVGVMFAYFRWSICHVLIL